MDKLLNTLRIETTSLKEQFLEMTKKWAENSYNVCDNRRKWNGETWCNFLGITPELRGEYLTFPRGFFNTKESKTYYNLKKECDRIISMGKEKYIIKEVNKSNDHYETSLLKLKERILTKGLNVDNMKIVTGRVGVNIEITLSDGDKVVKAFTIVAEGSIQRPHYRYLVK